MIQIGTFDPTVIPNILVYFIPGYLAICIFQKICGTVSQSSHRVWESCALSFIFTILAQICVPSHKKDDTLIIAMAAIIIGVTAAIIFAMIIRKDTVRNYFSNKMHFSPAKTVLSDVIRFGENGSTMRVYLKNVDYYVEGAVYAFSNTKDDQWIALCYYTKFDIGSNQIRAKQEENVERCFLFNLEDVVTIEIWPTETDDE